MQFDIKHGTLLTYRWVHFPSGKTGTQSGIFPSKDYFKQWLTEMNRQGSIIWRASLKNGRGSRWWYMEEK